MAENNAELITAFVDHRSNTALACTLVEKSEDLVRRTCGLRARIQSFHLNTPLIAGTANEFENFAYSLASGDFDGEGCAELAVGTLGDAVDGVHNAGSVLILPGSIAGLSSNGDQLLTSTPPDLSSREARLETVRIGPK